MKPKIYKIKGQTTNDGFGYEAGITIKHDGTDQETEIMAQNLSGVRDARIVQLEKIEGGGSGGPDLVEWLFIGLQMIFILSTQSLVGELGKETIKKLVRVLTKRPKKSVLHIAIREKEHYSHHHIEILLPKYLSDEDVHMVFELAEGVVKSLQGSERKVVVYNPKGKDLIPFD